VRGRFEVGAAGVGYISMNPYVCWGDTPMLTGTTANYTASIITQSVVNPGTMLTNFNNNSPYTIAQFNTFNNCRRVVGAGLRARYIGPELTRSGRVIEYRHPINGSVFTIGTGQIADYLRNRETEPGPVDREWHYVVWRPALPADIAYRDASSAFAASLLFAVEGAPPGAAFEFDAMVHFEIVGELCPTTSASHSDVIGHSVVSGAMELGAHQPDLPPKENFLSMAKGISSIASKTVSFLGPMLGVPEAGGIAAGLDAIIQSF